MWYVVQPGDTLYQLSRRFGVSIQAIREANQLVGDIIYVGQRLYIPTQGGQRIVYTVRPGDTLYRIAQRYNTTVESIMALNNLTSTVILVGQRLVIPLYTEVVVNVEMANIRSGPDTGYGILTQMVSGARLPVLEYRQGWYRVSLYDGREGWISGNIVNRRFHDGARPIQTILGFYTLEEGPNYPSSYNSFVNNVQNLSEVGLFMFRINRDNPTEIEKFGEFSDADVRNLVSIGHRNNIKMLPVVHNLLYRPGGVTASKDVVRELVSTVANRRAFALNLVELIERYNFDGVNIDIEDVYIEDSQRLSLLFNEIGSVLRSRGYFLSASIPSRVSDEPWNPFSAPFDYAAIAPALDQFVVMLYNEHGWPGSGPGPVVSIGWMERVLKYAMTKMPREKIVAAVSVFGFDFNLTTGVNTYLSYAMAIELAERYNRQIIFDPATQTPMFAYQDEQGNNHEVWFENSRSIMAKIQLAWKLGISGVALWRLGLEDPAMWTNIQSNVVVRKIVE